MKNLLSRNNEENDTSNGNGKSEYYTGNKTSRLLVHIIQDGVEVSKPVRTQIWKQEIEWRRRKYPISPDDFFWDYHGIAHQYVNANNTSALRFQLPKDLRCKQCGGNLRHPTDSRNIREMTKRGVIQAIWGIDSTHLILLFVAMFGVMGAIAFAVYEADQKDQLQAKIDSALASGNVKSLVPAGQSPNQVSQQTTVVK